MKTTYFNKRSMYYTKYNQIKRVQRDWYIFIAIIVSINIIVFSNI